MIINKYNNLIIKRIKESIIIKQDILKDSKEIEKIALVVVESYRNRKKVIIFGNGGSAADSQHIVAELLGKYYIKRKGLPAIALTTNTSSLTAISNDYSFNKIFARQIEALGEPGDVAIGISTSGNSKNVALGLEQAKKIGLIAIGLTGKNGGRLKKIADYCICVPTEDTPRIQEAHIFIGHIMCEIIEKELFIEE